MIRFLTLCVIGFALAACSQAGGQAARPAVPEKPYSRIVSLDYCADQYVLKLSDRENILAVSIDAKFPFSYMRAAAEGLPQVQPNAESILALKPDLVVRAYGGGPNLVNLLEGAGIPVLQIGPGDTLPAIRQTLLDAADGLKQSERGKKLAEDFDRRLDRLQRVGAKPAALPRPKALYMTPGGVTAGPGTLVDEMFQAANIENFEQTPGWRDLPLEQLAAGDHPDLIVAAFFESNRFQLHPWAASRHPVARAQLASRPVVALDGSWTTCGAWYLMDAIETLAASQQIEISRK